MSCLNEKEYAKFRQFLEPFTKKIFEHENDVLRGKGLEEQTYYQACFSWGDCFSWGTDDDSVKLFCAESPTFCSIVEDGLLINAQAKHPELFGTGKAEDVIKALYEEAKLQSYSGTFEEYVEYLRVESCAYIVEYHSDGTFREEVLRLDLFRLIQNNQFIGGLFHAFRHYSKDGINLSHGNDRNDVLSLGSIVFQMALAFYRSDKRDEDTVTSILDYGDKYDLVVVFYRESTNGTFFLTTAHLERKKV